MDSKPVECGICEQHPAGPPALHCFGCERHLGVKAVHRVELGKVWCEDCGPRYSLKTDRATALEELSLS